MSFRKKQKPDQTNTTVDSDQVKKNWNSPMQGVWREKYDKERQEAVKSGSGCGRCIEGIVRFGPNEEDRSECNCGREVKAEDSKQEKE